MTNREEFFKDLIERHLFSYTLDDGWLDMGDYRLKCFGSEPSYVLVLIFIDDESAFSFKSYEDLFRYFEDMFADWLSDSFYDGFKCWKNLTLRDMLGLKEYGYTFKYFEDELKEAFK